ncbi:STAS domain-containing protein [uncultured Ferrimonas sp.]|uniref:STAS domain-containing protein n=1 Tax=uncultured Ferrimonas sp. TaxID=432640 RepID=UPI0026189D9A|nr:STAS domain-containing protein [uncultured Ferrimonas sp.]
MAIAIDQNLQPLILAMPRQFDIQSVPAVKERFEAALADSTQPVILEFTQVAFIDSSGIGAVIFLFKRLKGQQRSIQIADVSGQPRRILTMLKVDRAIEFIGVGASV